MRILIGWILQEKKTKVKKLFFLVTYIIVLPGVGKILYSLKPVLDSSEKCKSVFRNGIIVGYRRGKNLNDMLVSRRMKKEL